jgi:hypothetical protein
MTNTKFLLFVHFRKPEQKQKLKVRYLRPYQGNNQIVGMVLDLVWHIFR